MLADMGPDLLGVAAVIVALTGMFTAVAQVLSLRNQGQMKAGVRDVSHLLATDNGRTPGQMIQDVHSHAALRVAPADRTDEDRAAIALLSDRQREAGVEAADAATLIVDTARTLAEEKRDTHGE